MANELPNRFIHNTTRYTTEIRIQEIGLKDKLPINTLQKSAVTILTHFNIHILLALRCEAAGLKQLEQLTNTKTTLKQTFGYLRYNKY